MQAQAVHKFDQEAFIRVGLQTFFNITAAWKLNETEKRILLGQPKEATYYKWKKTLKGALGKDIQERISLVLGIYKALHILFQRAEQADNWITKPNKYFANKSAKEVMCQGSIMDLYRVRQYLDATRG